MRKKDLKGQQQPANSPYFAGRWLGFGVGEVAKEEFGLTSNFEIFDKEIILHSLILQIIQGGEEVGDEIAFYLQMSNSLH